MAIWFLRKSWKSCYISISNCRIVRRQCKSSCSQRNELFKRLCKFKTFSLSENRVDRLRLRIVSKLEPSHCGKVATRTSLSRKLQNHRFFSVTKYRMSSNQKRLDTIATVFFFEQHNSHEMFSGVICETCHSEQISCRRVEKLSELMALRVAGRRRRDAFKGEIYCYPTIARPGAAFFVIFYWFFLHFRRSFIFLVSRWFTSGCTSTGMFAIDCRRRVLSLRWIIKRHDDEIPSKACSIDSEDNRVCVHLIYRLAKKNVWTETQWTAFNVKRPINPTREISIARNSKPIRDLSTFLVN